MKLRPFIVDDQVREALDNLQIHAMANIFSLGELFKIQAGTSPPAGALPGFSVILHFGYRVVFSIEDHPGGRYRHMSMSVNEKGVLPNPLVILEVMELLGFKAKSLKDPALMVDNITEKHAISVIEKYT